MKSNSYNRWYTLLKWLFSLVSLGYFIYLIQSHDWYDTFIPLFISAWNKFEIYFILVFFMVFLNWNFETQKFKLLLNSQRWSDRYLFFTVLGGMAISNFTPARSGEYIGRSLLLKKTSPLKIVIATVTGNIAQVIMTYGLGLMCLCIIFLFFDWYDAWFNTAYLIGVIFIFFALVSVTFYSKKIVAYINRFLPNKLHTLIKLMKHYERKRFGKVILLSFLRYLVFSSQLFMLLQVFSDFSLPTYTLFLVPVAFLLQTIVPIPAVSDIGVRVAVCSMLFEGFITETVIFQSVTFIWAINLIIPGILGSFFLLISNFIND
jgi:hypothetical protein